MNCMWRIKIMTLFFFCLKSFPLEMSNDIVVAENGSAKKQAPGRGVIVFVPKAPSDQVTFIINAPSSVMVNEQYTIDYAIKTINSVHIPFWTDLIPDGEHPDVGGLRVLKYGSPTVGQFDAQHKSHVLKGGKGRWNFPTNGIPAHSVHHFTVTLKSILPGIKQFTTMVATNPPACIGPISTAITDDPPQANPDFASCQQNDEVVITVLDNDSASSVLKISAITQPMHGGAVLNNDNTITYSPHRGFFGSDSFTYTIQDVAGNTDTGLVSITIVEYHPMMVF